MEKIDLNKYKDLKVTSGRKRNVTWEEAEVMGKYIKVSTPFIMKLFKKFGKNKVLNCQSYLKDFNGDCSLEQAIVFKLTHLTSE